MKNRPRTALAILGLAAGVSVLCAALLLPSGPHFAPETDSVAESAVPSAVGQAGMRAFVDPETGELRAPTREELARMAADAPRALSKSAGDIEVIEHPNGMRSAILDERFMSTSVAKVGPDGKLITECFDSQAEADAFLAGETSAPKLEVQ